MELVGKDNFTYPMSSSTLKICLEKDVAFLRMKRVVARPIVVATTTVTVSSGGREKNEGGLNFGVWGWGWVR